MPQLGLTMTEGTLQEWMVQPGDRYIKGQVLFVVETEKAANNLGQAWLKTSRTVIRVQA